MSFCAGRIRYPTLRLRVLTAQNTLQLVLVNADQEHLIDPVMSSYAAFGNLLGTAIPLYGVVTPTFQNAGDIQRAREEQAHKNRR